MQRKLPGMLARSDSHRQRPMSCCSFEIGKGFLVFQMLRIQIYHQSVDCNSVERKSMTYTLQDRSSSSLEASNLKRVSSPFGPLSPRYFFTNPLIADSKGSDLKRCRPRTTLKNRPALLFGIRLSVGNISGANFKYSLIHVWMSI